MWQRTLSVYVDVNEAWLMGDADEYEPPGWDDDMVIASPSWDELRNDVQVALNRFYQYYHVPVAGRPKFDVDWEDKPEKA